MASMLRYPHPLMLRAIDAEKKKNDRIDAAKIADCLRCDFLSEATWRRQPSGSFGGRSADCLKRFYDSFITKSVSVLRPSVTVFQCTE